MCLRFSSFDHNVSASLRKPRAGRARSREGKAPTGLGPSLWNSELPKSVSLTMPLRAVTWFEWIDQRYSNPASVPDDAKHSIDANLIRWLLTDIDAQKLLDPSGVRIRGAVIDGTLNLDDLTITLPLSLVRCKIDSGMELIGTRARVLNLERSKVSWIEAPGLSLDRDLFLQDGRYGQIILENATLGGTVHLEGAMLGNVSNDYLSSDNALLDLNNPIHDVNQS